MGELRQGPECRQVNFHKGSGHAENASACGVGVRALFVLYAPRPQLPTLAVGHTSLPSACTARRQLRTVTRALPGAKVNLAARFNCQLLTSTASLLGLATFTQAGAGEAEKRARRYCTCPRSRHANRKRSQYVQNQRRRPLTVGATGCHTCTS